jgi:hypothetical protein
MRLPDHLLDRVVAALPAELHEHVVVFGSAPIFAGSASTVPPGKPAPTQA